MKNIFLNTNIICKLFLSLALLLSGFVFSSCSDDEKEDIQPINIEISLDKSNEDMKVGETLVLTPTFKGTDADKLEYVWVSSNKEIATVIKNADKSATVTAVAAGTATIKIIYSKDTRFYATCSVTVSGDQIEPQGTIRILAIGNSFSQDAVEQYFYDLAKAEGIEVVVGNLYYGGCSLEKHLTFANGNTAAYEYRKVVNGAKTNTKSFTLAQGLADEQWDYISLQQASGYSGIYDTYTASLPTLVKYVKERATNKNMKLMLHQTWAYASNSTHEHYHFYEKNQTKMYEAIVEANTKAAQLVNIDIVVPSGTAIQNGRTSYIGDNFCRDGYHLETTYGRYTAACTWFEKIFNKTIVGNTYAPKTISDYDKQIAQNAAHYAVLKPNEVTDMVEFKNEEGDKDNEKVLENPILIDFGSVTSPDPWNNISSVSSTSRVELWDNKGNSTGIKISVSDPFGGINTIGETTTTTTWNMPESVSKDSFWGNTGAAFEGKNITKAGFLVSSLNKKMKYTFTFFSSRASISDNRETKFTVTGKSQAEPVYLNASLNKTETTSVANMEPNDEGKVSISLTSGPNNNNVNGFFYINALMITPVQ